MSDEQLVIEHPENHGRNVTLICGPPGSGKSTLARQLHADVLELEQFLADDYAVRLKLYGRRAYRIGRNSLADVGVVRGAPGQAERDHHVKLCRPSRTIVLLTPPQVCHDRVTARNRPRAAGEHEAIDAWWRTWLGEKMPARNRTHYAGDYQQRARAVRAAAYADPRTQCWRCGKTLSEHGPSARWDAGHVRDGDPTSPLAPEAASCNRSAGATRGNRMRGQGTTRAW